MSRVFEIFSRTKRPERMKVEYQKDYIDYEYKEVKKSTGDNEDDFEIEVKEIQNKTNIEKFVNSFAGQVGVEAALNKAMKSGDLSLLNERPEIHADLTQIPEDPEERFNLSQANLEEAMKELDPDLTEGMAPEEFVKSLSLEKLQAYIDKKVKQAQANKEAPKKEVEKE